MKRIIFALFLIFAFCSHSFALEKNVASQKWVVFCFDETDHTAKAGDAAQITAEVSIDGVAGVAVTDANPTELEDGYYAFDIDADETNGDYVAMMPESSTGNIQCYGCPRATWTTAPDYNTAPSTLIWDANRASHTGDGNFGGDAVDADLLDTTATVVDAFMDEDIEGTYSHSDLMRLFSAFIAGKTSVVKNGAEDWDITYRNIGDGYLHF